jgi:hypothetical protein
MDKYKKDPKEYKIIDGVVSVMARHLYETSNIFDVVNAINADGNKDEPKKEKPLDEETEKIIESYGINILDSLVEMNEVTRMMKILKESSISFIPGKSLPQAAEELENALLFFYCMLKVKKYFNVIANEIIDIIKALIKKEVSFIENYKKDNLNEQKKNEKYHDELKASAKRIKLQSSVLQIISSECMSAHEDQVKDDSQKAIKNNINLNHLKTLLKTFMEFFEKSSDEENINSILEHIKKNTQFYLTYEHDLNISEIETNNKNAAFSKFQQKTNNNKFEETIIEKLTSNLISLLRKNIDHPEISKNIMKILQGITKKKPAICDLLVKAGCPRLLMTILENSQNPDIAKPALNLLKTLTFSSEENTDMLINQSKNLLEKLNYNKMFLFKIFRYF